MSHALDYFYKKVCGRTCFYIRSTRKQIAKKNIPANINIEDIPEYNNFDEILRIENEKQKYMTKLLELQKIIADLDEKSRVLKIGTNWEEEKRRYDDKQREEEKRRKQEEEEKRRKQEEQKRQEEEEKRRKDQYNEAYKKLMESQVKKKKILSDLGISNKSQYKQWLLKNHPDKNPKADIEICKRVMEAVKELLT